MSGNLYEWTADDLDTPGQHSSGAVNRVFRGGSWNFDASASRTSSRLGYNFHYSINLIGLRFSRPLPPDD